MGACIDGDRPRKRSIEEMKEYPRQKSKRENKSMNSEVYGENEAAAKGLPTFRKILSSQLLMEYSIEHTLELSSKIQGPKYLVNLIDGSNRVLRVYDKSEINYDRLSAYTSILGLQVYEDEEGALLIFDEYCSGEDLPELLSKFRAVTEPEDKLSIQEQLLSFVQTTYKVITRFHQSKTFLGNLGISSFRKVSDFCHRVRLVQMKFGEHSEQFQMGCSVTGREGADWQFFGYMLQFVVTEQVPIYVPHKMQYFQYGAIPCGLLIHEFLKGRRVSEDKLNDLTASTLLSLDSKVRLGYILRNDINKLLKIRRKRKGHNRKYYGNDIKQLITQGRLVEQMLHRYETDRVLAIIERYIEEINGQQQEAFLAYDGQADRFRKLKSIFLVRKEQKMEQLKECLLTIK